MNNAGYWILSDACSLEALRARISVSEHLLTMKQHTKQITYKNGQRASARDRQASLIVAAASLFAAKGFNGTTTREIAKAAGVSEALVFKYFPTKRTLYAAILAERVSVTELLEARSEERRVGKECRSRWELYD